MNYIGLVIKESLLKDLPKQFKIISKKTVPGENQGETWTELTISTNKNQTDDLSKIIDAYGWHAVFMNGSKGIVVFQNKTFTVDTKNTSTWGAVYKHGKEQGLDEKDINLENEFAKISAGIENLQQITKIIADKSRS